MPYTWKYLNDHSYEWFSADYLEDIFTFCILNTVMLSDNSGTCAWTTAEQAVMETR